MSTHRIHEELKALSPEEPAAYIHPSVLGQYTLARLLRTIDTFSDKVIPTEHQHLGIRFVELKWLPSVPSLEVRKAYSEEFEFSSDGVELHVTSDLTATVQIFLTEPGTTFESVYPGDEKLISTIDVSIRNMRIPLSANGNEIVMLPPRFKYSREVQRVEEAESRLEVAGIDEWEASHMEGHIIYGVVSQVIANSLSSSVRVPLDRLFPTVDFGEAIKLVVLTGGELGILPSNRVIVRSSAICHCQLGPDYELTGGSVQVEPNIDIENIGPGTSLANAVSGGLVTDGLDPRVDFGPRAPGAGPTAGLYIPAKFATEHMAKTLPSITVKMRDDKSIIGYNTSVTVAFPDLEVRFDEQNGGIIIAMGIDIHGTAYCDYEVFKGVRLPIGRADLIHDQPGRLEIGLYPAIDGDGVKLRSTLIKNDMGRMRVVVVGPGEALKLLGAAAWIAFLVDFLLEALLSYAIPKELRKRVRKYIGEREWDLIDFEDIFDSTQADYYIRTGATYSVDEDSLMASFEYTD